MGIALFQSPILWEIIMINKLLLVISTLGVCAFTSIAYFSGADIYYQGYVALAPLGILFLSGVIAGLLLSLTIIKVAE